MRTPAQFFRIVAHGNHPNIFAVFFVEQRHGARFEGLFEGKGFLLHGRIDPNSLVHLSFDGIQFSRGQRFGMGKIEDTVKILLDIDKVLAGDDFSGLSGDIDDTSGTDDKN